MEETTISNHGRESTAEAYEWALWDALAYFTERAEAA